MSLKERYEKGKTTLLNDRSICKGNRALFTRFFDWEEEKLKRINDLPEIDNSSYKTLHGYINRFRNVNKWFENKPWKNLTLAEIKGVYRDLEDGKIKNRNGKRFEDRRSYYNKVFKSKPFKLAGKNEEVKQALEFFTDRRKKEVRFVNEKNFKRMISVLSKPQHFALFWLAWDIGENINSLLRLTKKNFKKQINRQTKEPEYLVYLSQTNLKRSRQSRSEPTLYQETVRYLEIVLQSLNDEDLIFPFGYRQALKIFDSAAKKSNAKCEPNSNKPSWKDLRSGMACYLFSQGWHSDDINLRLGHSISSRELDVYLNYMAQNRKRAKKIMYNNNLEDVKDDLEEARRREKLLLNRFERQKRDVEEQGMKIIQLEKAMRDVRDFGDVASNLFENKEVQRALLQSMMKKGFGKQLMNLYGRGNKRQQIIDHVNQSFSPDCPNEFSQTEKEKIFNDANSCISRFYKFTDGQNKQI